MTGVTRQKAEHEGNPLAGLTKRIRSMGMRDETGPGTSKGKGSEGHARNSAQAAAAGRDSVRRAVNCCTALLTRETTALTANRGRDPIARSHAQGPPTPQGRPAALALSPALVELHPA